MTTRLIRLPLKTEGYIWIDPDWIRLIRTSRNYHPDTHWIQLEDGLEYELFGGPKNTLAALGVKYDD